ncbi:MAG: 6-carboxytetrahydropterin synthase QueD [Planctomycetes bacterium]|nr:6-carboxytetrahydropterin synthase QueD [Planctomycetota bacterium]
MYEIERDYSFESARRLPLLPPGHPCSRTHGHSFGVRVVVRGELDESRGWVLDYAEIDAAFAPLHEQLDHRYLNEVQGLENPTSEILARWIFDRLRRRVPGLVEVSLSEEGTARCRYRPEPENRS